MTETIGICRFCGQVYNYDERLELEENELNENATKSCSCNEARAYSKKISDAEYFDQKREAEIIRGSQQISDMFGGGAAKYDVEQVDDEIIELLNTILVLMIDGELKSVSINVNSTTKVSFAKSTKGKVSITRADNATFKKEV